MRVRTRFAPSPTGFQHIGGFRTAFFAWALAKHFGGEFILRIEDTDQERKVNGAVSFILDELAWFGIDIDEGPSKEDLERLGEKSDHLPKGGNKGPYIQSLRLPKYKEVAEKLIEADFAYRCDCTPAMLEKERLDQMARKEVPGYSGYCRTRAVSKDKSHTIRFKMPHKPKLSMQDAVKGLVSWDNPPLRDPVLLKSDGYPTYHLAVVVDDHEMEITHVMRGDEWLPSTPIHLLLYQALGWDTPVFAHLPVILGEDGKKLSKRHGAPTSRELREKGFLPEAIFNFVMLIGWSPGGEQEVFSKDEIVKLFSLDRINNASGVFLPSKLEWMNGKYIRDLSREEFFRRVKEFWPEIDFIKDQFLELSPHIQERAKTLLEVPHMIEFLTNKKINREWDKVIKKEITREVAKNLLKELKELLAALDDFEVESIDKAVRTYAENKGLKIGSVFPLLRIATLYTSGTPPLFESLKVLGKDQVLIRIDEALKELLS